LITLLDAHLAYGDRPLLDGAQLSVRAGERVGLIGRNGTGKSSLLRVIAGQAQLDDGEIQRRDSMRTTFVEQEPILPESPTLRESLLARAALEPNAAEQHADERERWRMEARLTEFMQRFDLDPERAPATSSGGERKRAALALALSLQPDVLLLDEPTNHLDINTIRWLEGVLNARSSTMVIISHDRHFLNSVCTHMADLDYGTIRVYPGGYDDYMIASTQARERLLSQNAKAKDRIAELEEFVRRFRANKSKARQATSRARAIEKIKVEDIKPSSRQNPYIRFDLDGKSRLHRQAVEMSGVAKSFDKPLFEDMSMLLEAGQRLAIIGPNGAGKTSLLRTLAGEIEPDDGTVKWAEKAALGYYPQDQSDEFDSDLTVLEWMQQWAGADDDDQAVRSVLGKLLFSGDDAAKPVRVLSGGERGRMLFGKLMLQRPNVLLMDEPTNHMDMESIESLNLGLERYSGTLIFVSHDRQFVSSLATQIIEFAPGGVVHYPGNYDDYLAARGIV